ncbi:hypothetical protein ABKA04_000766 [Annulohypoxylon sp. FPYF3050]
MMNTPVADANVDEPQFQSPPHFQYGVQQEAHHPHQPQYQAQQQQQQHHHHHHNQSPLANPGAVLATALQSYTGSLSQTFNSIGMDMTILFERLHMLRDYVNGSYNTMTERADALQAEVANLREEVKNLTKAAQSRERLPHPSKLAHRDHTIAWMLEISAKLEIDGAAIGGEKEQFFYVYACLGPEAQVCVNDTFTTAEAAGTWAVGDLLLAVIREYAPTQAAHIEVWVVQNFHTTGAAQPAAAMPAAGQ